MRSLPDRFSSKVIAIEKAKDLDSMKVDDLMGSLHAFEMTLKQRKKEKSTALKMVHEEEFSSEEDDDDELALLTKNFKKFLKKVGKPSKSSSSFPRATKSKNPLVPKRFDFSNNKKGIQCRECEGFSHIQFECANTRKKKNEALKSTWSDEESKGSQEDDELVSNQVTFSVSLISNDRVFMQGRAGVATDSICLSAKIVSVVLENKSAKSEFGSKYDCGDEFEKMMNLYIRRMRRCMYSVLRCEPQTVL